MMNTYHAQLANTTKKRNPFRRHWFPGRDKTKTVGTRRELASLIFDALLAGTPQAEVELQIRRAANSVMEADAAISRYCLAVGCSGKAVQL
jgi:hypothetical protein